MEIDLAQSGGDGVAEMPLRVGICIVGGGIAGLLLAERLADAGCDVLLLEAGGTSGQGSVEAAGPVHCVGEPYQASIVDRVEALGGGSLVWGGQLLPLRDDRGWPVREAALRPFYPAIHALLGAGGTDYRHPGEDHALDPALQHFLRSLHGLEARFSRFAPFQRRNLAASLGSRLRRHPRARVLLHARAVELLFPATGDRAEGVLFRLPSGAIGRVAAKVVVLAAGTLGSCALLLRSRARMRIAAGTAPDPLGEGLHDHLTVVAARFGGPARAQAAALFRPWISSGLRGPLRALKLEPSPALRDAMGLQPAVGHITFEEPAGSGAEAVRALLRDRQRGQTAAPVGARAATVRSSAAVLLRLAAMAVTERRRYVSPSASVCLRVNTAQAVRRDNGVRLLQSERDAGAPALQVTWTPGPEALRTLRVFSARLRCGFPPSAWGGMEWNPDVLPGGESKDAADACRDDGRWLAAREEELTRPIPALEDARHTMGGACMGTDPRTSVVDPELRVHGVENLYVASAAVFPDGAAQLPTLTLMALTLRLAEKLRQVLGSSVEPLPRVDSAR